MTQDLISRLRVAAPAGMLTAHVKILREAADALERLRAEVGRAQAEAADECSARMAAEQAARYAMTDAACFRFWVSEAARSPCNMAKLIANCVTEDDYRRAIMPCVIQGEMAVDSARSK